MGEPSGGPSTSFRIGITNPGVIRFQQEVVITHPELLVRRDLGSLGRCHDHLQMIVVHSSPKELVWVKLNTFRHGLYSSNHLSSIICPRCPPTYDICISTLDPGRIAMSLCTLGLNNERTN